MGVIVLLIAFSLLVALTFLAAFFWAVKSGQFDDPQTPSMRMLFDDTKPTESKTTLTKQREE
jgi:cbb3-type cytochrome oxidase maturation protein